MKEIYEVHENNIGYRRLNSTLFESIEGAKKHMYKRVSELKTELEVLPNQNFEYMEYNHAEDMIDLHPDRVGYMAFDYIPLQCSEGDDRWSDEYEIILDARELNVD